MGSLSAQSKSMRQKTLFGVCISAYNAVDRDLVKRNEDHKSENNHKYFSSVSGKSCFDTWPLASSKQTNQPKL